MSQTDDQSPGDKEHAPSQKKLDDARKEGDVAKSSELAAAAAYGGLLIAGLASANLIDSAAQSGATLIDRAPELSRLAAESGRSLVGALLGSTVLSLGLLFALPAAATFLILVLQKAIVFAPSKLNPKLSRISPLAMAKNKFGPDGLVEFIKSFAKLLLVAVSLAWFLKSHSDGILATATLDPRTALLYLFGLLGQFLLIVILLTTGLGALDYLWQRHALLKRNRMSRKDMMDEAKDSEGDPHAKAQRRQKGQEIAMNQMLADVASANVVIVNPTHYAVALKWSRGSRSAPIVVAKGVDDLARRIREKAAENAVPLHSDPPTARALFASVDVGQPIQRDHYRAVASAIRFAEAMRKRAKGQFK